MLTLLNEGDKEHVDYEPELDLSNPYSKASCLILQLYSMELGYPQLYAEANRVAREMDKSLLYELGPFLCALSRITLHAEKGKMKHDKILTGKFLKGVD